MNCTYRSIWNDTSGTFVAVSENASSAGKKSTSSTRAQGGAAGLALKTLVMALMLSFGATVHALPAGGVVAAGDASISSTAGSTTITQSTSSAAINWQSFSIGATEAVRFVQPSSSSVTLNRVLGADPSSILGSLSANGKVFLVNPNGILFGQGASVNVGGLVASTLDIADSDFMAGRYRFNGSSGATLVNQGAINADGGYVALLGANVSNQGVISARLGTVALAAGNAITLDVAGDGLLNVTVDQGAVDALVQNGGLIQADGGQVLLTALSAGNLLQSAVNNTGVIQAQTIENRNGTIRLLGDMQSGTMNISGTLDVSGTAAGQTGGNVTVTGHHVGLFGASINAAGDAGGGTVLVGGGFQGNNPAVPNASATYMSAGSTINVDAITNGNGGTAVLWGNDSTRAHGSITARGGAQGGNGGLIETSGHSLDVFGIGINASAPNGKNGLWLLDPSDVTITDTGGTTNGAFDGANPNVFSPSSGAAVTTVDRDALQVILGVGGLGTDVTITTTNTGAAGTGAGNITVASAITWTPTNFTTLTLDAAGDVNINAAVTTTRGNLVVCCGQDINVNALITTTGVVATPNSGGNVLLAAGRDVNIARTLLTPLAGITTTSGNMEICAGRDINLSNTSDGAALLTLTNSVGDSLPPNGPVTPRGLTLMAGTSGTGPGAAGGTLNIGAGTIITVTGPAGISPINIFYNPTSYITPTDYSGFFATGNGGPYVQYMLVFPDGANKIYDGTTAATFTSLKGTPAGVTLNTAGGTATFDDKNVAADIGITYTGFTLTQAPIVTGGAAINYALPVSCCAPIVSRTTANITPLALIGAITAADKVYDANNTATITSRTLTGAINGDEVSYSGGSATFDTPAPGANKAVAGTGLGLSGADAGNYTVNPSATTTASITPIVGTTPIETTPIETTPIETTPIATGEDFDTGEDVGSRPRRGIVPALTTVVLADTPPQLLALAPLPPPAPAPVATPPVVEAPTPIMMPAQPPQIYVAPVRPPKQDRN